MAPNVALTRFHSGILGGLSLLFVLALSRTLFLSSPVFLPFKNQNFQILFYAGCRTGIPGKANVPSSLNIIIFCQYQIT